MGRNNFKKALKHIESRSVDKNIARLNGELKKTGMLSEKMTTSTVLPPTETQSYIAPTTSDVPDSSGLMGDDFSQPTNGGDEDDSSTWETGWSNNDYFTNPNDLNGETNIPILTKVSKLDNNTVDYPFDDGGDKSTIIFGPSAFGIGVGVIDGDNKFRQILNPGIGGGTLRPMYANRYSGTYRQLTDGEFAYAVALWDAYQALKTKLDAGEIGKGVVSAWRQWNRYHDAGDGVFANYPYVKRSNGLILKGYNYFKQRNTYISDNGQPRTTVLNRLEDPSSPDYYEGNFARYMANMLGLSKKALEYLDQKSEVAASYPTTNTPLDKQGGFKGLPKGKGWYPTDKDGNPYNPQTGLPVKASAGKDDEVALDTIPYEPPSPGPGGYKRPGSYDPGKFYDLKNDPSQFPSPNLPSTGPGRSSVPDDANVARVNDQPDDNPAQIKWPRNYFPNKKAPPGPGYRPPTAKKKKKTNMVAHHEPEGEVLSEGWQSPDHTNVEKDPKTRWFSPNAGTDSAKWFDPKEVKPIYPEEPPKMIDGYNVKSNLVPKPVEKLPTIKITKKDLLRNHKLKDSEIEELMLTIDRINKFIAAHPEELIYAQSRYPKHDPRLAELNWKMDQMLNASNEYLDKQFPENERLFNRLKSATQKTIDLTDPEIYKNDAGNLTSMGNLAKVDTVMNHYEPKDRVVSKIKVERKKSVNRFFAKPKRPDRPAYLRKKKKGKPNS